MVQGAQHYSFSDLPFLVEVLGLQNTREVEGQLGTVDGDRMVGILSEYLVAFFSFDFDGRSERLLEGAVKEVKFVASGQ